MVAEVVAAVVFDPAKDELFSAEKGDGAFVNDQRLRVSGRRDMNSAIFATGVPFGGRGTLPATLKDLARLMPVCTGVRRWGSAALDLAYVAAGRYDGYWERGINAWAVAARRSSPLTVSMVRPNTSAAVARCTSAPDSNAPTRPGSPDRWAMMRSSICE